MEKIIFSKFSSERKSKYKILTKVVEDDTKNRKVLKVSMGDFKSKHIKNIAENMFKLKSYYLDERLVVTPCELVDNRTVVFEYIDGIRYDEYLNGFFSDENFELLKNELKRLKEIMSNVAEISGFFITDEFVSVFGDYKYEEILGSKSFVISNIDMIFGNIIIKEDKLYITDYEWVFNFPVPINYVIYRSVLLNADISILEDDKKRELYEILEISSKEIEIYNNMEKFFQEYVSGKNLFEDYKKKSDNITISLNTRPDLFNIRNLHIFSINEDDSINKINSIPIYKEELHIKQDVLETCKKVVFNFNTNGMILKLKSIVGIDNQNIKYKDLAIKTNADLVIGEDYYFKYNNPQIEITNNQFEFILAELLIYDENNSMVACYVEKILECNNYKLENIDLNKQFILKDSEINYRDNIIQELNKKVDNLENTLQDVNNTFVWKVYKKLTHKK